MILKKTILLLISFGGGVTVGGATAAFLTILKILPRICQATNTRKHVKLYEIIMTVALVLSVIIYFSQVNLNLPKFLVVIFGLIYGIFTGMFSSALAEVLNVIPILSKKFKLKNSLRPLIWALMGGKVMGALIFWIYLNRR